MPQQAVFLDRDGVINEDRHYVCRPEEFVFRDGVIQTLTELQRLEFAIVVVTNQSGIARGYYTEQDFKALNDWMLAVLAGCGVQITDVYFCPHRPEDRCACRKPAPGMILRAAREHELDLSRSWLVGDKASDIEAACRAGIPNTVLLGSQYTPGPNDAKPLYVCDSVPDIIRLVRSPGPLT